VSSQFLTWLVFITDSLNFAAAELLCIFLYWFAQTALALMPIQKLRILFWVKGVIVSVKLDIELHLLTSSRFLRRSLLSSFGPSL
jgi:cytosine/uracil/thiamine/allantoin permease